MHSGWIGSYVEQKCKLKNQQVPMPRAVADVIEVRAMQTVIHTS